MKTEKLAPRRASFPEESIEARHPIHTATLTADQAANQALLSATRSDCIRTIIRLVGKGGLQAFLACPQPALEDLTGAQLLENAPSLLIRRLKWLDHVGELDSETADSGIGQAANRQEPQVAQVLENLDELERRTHEQGFQKTIHSNLA